MGITVGPQSPPPTHTDMVLKCGSLLICLLQLSTLCTVAEGKSKKKNYINTIKFERFEECKKHGPNRIENVNIRMLGRGINSISLDLRFVELVKESRVWVTLYKCTSISMNDCEVFVKWNMDFCKTVLEDNQPWSQFLKDVQPKMKCPLKGVYRFLNSTLDPTSVMAIGSVVPPIDWMQQYLWMAKFELMTPDKSKTLACGYSIIAFQRARV